jgi:hypothetical protein
MRSNCIVMNKLLFLLLLSFSCLMLSITPQVKGKTMSNRKKVEVKVLGIKGCEATRKTVELVKSVSEAMDVEIDLNVITVLSSEQAQKEHFIGSPTVMVNGIDIDPSARDVKSFAVG